jgi:hypothetical protein
LPANQCKGFSVKNLEVLLALSYWFTT